ncbi:class I SAM-dependent methyltransferase [Marilutibacter alkalisoli]|uniref:Methyltransferase domain-containing protein n=1 Tax=Marilutibacter alkalisoli TaxID=2591633 RepID=A0A514BQ67_9GAMM|nr:class I SAM-dependent methyltransferase [Lysobacter alkalisoli]QDH69542.1 methyltransferase domain-containing protein [Lysobacter alkalisoli]
MDEREFKQVSRAVWEAMAPGWVARHAYFEEIARPVTVRMLERLDPSPGEEILDLAAGTGIVGFAAAAMVGPEGKVIVSDFAEAMVAAATRRAGELRLDNVECRVLDAEALDLPDGCVDGVACRWGYMLMADPGAALRETRRVLREGGRVACAVFSGPERNPWAALPARILVECGHMPPPKPGDPGILALADRDRLRGLFTTAGFGGPVIEEVDFVVRADDVDDYWNLLSHAAGAIAMVLNRLDADERDRVRTRIAGAIGRFSRDGRIAIPAQSLVVSAS